MKVAASSPSARPVQRLWLVVASVFILHLICYQAAAPLRRSSHLSHLVKRSAALEVSNPPAGEEVSLVPSQGRRWEADELFDAGGVLDRVPGDLLQCLPCG